jgi:hypothetical protein
VQFLHVQNSGIYFVLTTTVNVSPNLGLEMLARMVLVVGDYCGSISEEAIRKNFLMIYELIDEMMVRFAVEFMRCIICCLLFLLFAFYYYSLVLFWFFFFFLYLFLPI